MLTLKQARAEMRKGIELVAFFKPEAGAELFHGKLVVAVIGSKRVTMRTAGAQFDLSAVIGFAVKAS